MRTELVRGTLHIDLFSVLEELSGEALIELADTLSCIDTVIQHVADQICTGWTSHGSHGGVCIAKPEPVTALDHARRQVAEAASEVAAAEISSLKRSLQSSIDEANLLRDELSRLRERRNCW